MNMEQAYETAKAILGPGAVVSKELQISSGGRSCVYSVGVEDGTSMRVLATGSSWHSVLALTRIEKYRGRTR